MAWAIFVLLLMKLGLMFFCGFMLVTFALKGDYEAATFYLLGFGITAWAFQMTFEVKR